MAVDKSPSTTLRPEYLERAYATYPGANFLHLTRHPRTTGESIVKQLRQGDARGAPRSDQLDPQAAWMRAHTNIVNFAVTLPEGQCLRIKAEDLLSEPELYLPQIAEWLGLDTGAAAIEAMMHPERSPYASPGPEAARFGNDAEFLERPAYRRERVTEPALLGRLSWVPDADFDKPTLKLARELGYA
jgi:hypothetical protein